MSSVELAEDRVIRLPLMDFRGFLTESVVQKATISFDAYRKLAGPLDSGVVAKPDTLQIRIAGFE